MEIERDVSKAVLRIGIGLIFLYFGFAQAISPDSWAAYVPSFLSGGIISANNLVILNSIFELTLGLFLIFGIYTRISSLLLAVHLFFISLSIGFNPIGVRDFGLSVATLVIFLNGPDRFCLDNKKSMRRKATNLP